jgi:hypothetical protein
LGLCAFWEFVAANDVAIKTSKDVNAAVKTSSPCDKINTLQNMQTYTHFKSKVHWRRAVICAIASILIVQKTKSDSPIVHCMAVWIAYTLTESFADFHMREVNNIATERILSNMKVGTSASCSTDVYEDNPADLMQSRNFLTKE